MSDGYDPALVVTVPSLSGLTIGASAGSEGAAANALATVADGAIVVSSGAYYVFAGGRAFGIPAPPSSLLCEGAIRRRSCTGTVSSSLTSASLANGTLLSGSGPVYVSYRGELFIFKSDRPARRRRLRRHGSRPGARYGRPARRDRLQPAPERPGLARTLNSGFRVFAVATALAAVSP